MSLREKNVIVEALKAENNEKGNLKKPRQEAKK